MQHANRSSRSVALLWAAALAPALSAQGSYIDLGPGDAYAVSDDGTVVAGLAAGDVYRWTASGGMETLLPFTGLGGNLDMSGDGNVLTFDLRDPGSGRAVAARWTRFLGWQPIGSLPGLGTTGCGLSDAYATNGDGSVVVGLGWESCRGTAFRWDSGSGTMIGLPKIGRASRANCVSGDGNTIGGWDSDPMTGVRVAAVWFPDSRGEVLMIPRSPANPPGLGEVWEINSDGSVIVGGTINGGEPFRWTTAGGYQELGRLPAVGDPPTAYATSEDGSMVAGAFGNAFGSTAFMWTEEDGMMELESFLQMQGISVPPGQPFNFVFDMSPNGKALVGRRGTFLSMPPARGFLVQMPVARKYRVNAAPANTLDLAGGGSAAIGQTFVATTSNAELGQAFMVLGTSSLPSFPLAGGALLVNPFLVLPTVPTGPTTTSFSLPIPNNPAWVGFSLYFQALAPSAVEPEGWALSNGLKVTLES